MKLLGNACGIALLMAAMAPTTVYAAPSSEGEIGYARGSLGYDALVAGRNEQAITQLLSSEGVSRNDPARLINLGQAYARTGRIGEAMTLFQTVIESSEQVDLIMANGKVMGSRTAARLAMSQWQTRLASR